MITNGTAEDSISFGGSKNLTSQLKIDLLPGKGINGGEGEVQGTELDYSK